MKRFHYFMLFSCITMLAACDPLLPQTTSDSGVAKMSVQVETNPSGHTSEQENIAAKYKEDNKPGAIKHLYVISAMTGDVILYSTVKGKVTSSGKRLTPNSVNGYNLNNTTYSENVVEIGSRKFSTNEVIQDDGTFGSSSEYIYWWDVRGVFHQHYISGGQIVHISNQPLAVNKVIINLEKSN